MTKDSDFKRLVRERRARTGESYVTARRNLRFERGAPEVIGHELALAGRSMTAAEAEGLERHVLSHPSDSRARARLLGYYLLDVGSNAGPRTQHVMWFIENDPRCPLAGTPFCYLDKVDERRQEADTLWLAHIDAAPDDAPLLANASSWFALNDRELAIALAERVVDLTGAVEARMRLAHLVRLPSPPDADNSGAAIETGQRVLTALGDRPEAAPALPSWLQSAAWAALTAGELDYARELADELLAYAQDDAWYSGNAKHHGHLVRGHVAIADGDIGAAEAELVAAATTRGSPQLNSFGPNLSLAAVLLKLGRTAPVIRFLMDCRRFWAPPATGEGPWSGVVSEVDRRVADWIRVIEEGGTPDFGANLRYGG